MVTNNRLSRLLTLGLACSVGCAGWVPREKKTAKRDPEPAAKVAAHEAQASATARPVVPPNATAARPLEAVHPHEPQPGFFSTTFAKAKQKAADALTIQPKVIPPDDPTRLSSKPEKVGPEVFVQMARISEHRGQFDAAVEQYRQALQSDPHHLTALVSLGRLYDRGARLDDAIDVYRRAIAAHPTHGLPHNDLGLCYARKGQVDQALIELNEAVRLEPKSKLYRNNVATVLVELGRPAEAFDHLLAAHPPAAAHFNLGFLLRQKDDLNSARAQFARALELDPTFAPARQILAELGPPSAPPANPATLAPIEMPNAPVYGQPAPVPVLPPQARSGRVNELRAGPVSPSAARASFDAPRGAATLRIVDAPEGALRTPAPREFVPRSKAREIQGVRVESAPPAPIVEIAP